MIKIQVENVGGLEAPRPAEVNVGHTIRDYINEVGSDIGYRPGMVCRVNGVEESNYDTRPSDGAMITFAQASKERGQA